MKHSICLETVFTELSFYDRFEPIAKDGFNYVEFWTCEDKNLTRIKELCNKYNLSIASFSGDKEFDLVNINQENLFMSFEKVKNSSSRLVISSVKSICHQKMSFFKDCLPLA